VRLAKTFAVELISIVASFNALGRVIASIIPMHADASSEYLEFNRCRHASESPRPQIDELET
jgi:hypothetical protein